MSSGRHLELAAKFYVVSVLHRLGAEANVTFAPPDNVDITVVQESGQALTVDVKMLRGTKAWAVEPLRARAHHFVVFVCFPRVGSKAGGDSRRVRRAFGATQAARE